MPSLCMRAPKLWRIRREGWRGRERKREREKYLANHITPVTAGRQKEKGVVVYPLPRTPKSLV